MTIFEEKTEILRSFPLKFKGPRSEVRHLQEKHVNTIGPIRDEQLREFTGKIKP